MYFDAQDVGLEPRAVHESHGENWQDHDKADRYRKALTAVSAALHHRPPITGQVKVVWGDDNDVASFSLVVVAEDYLVTCDVEDAEAPGRAYAKVLPWSKLETITADGAHHAKDKTDVRSVTLHFSGGREYSFVRRHDRDTSVDRVVAVATERLSR